MKRILVVIPMLLLLIGCFGKKPQYPTELAHGYDIKVISSLTKKPIFGATVRCFCDDNEVDASIFVTGKDGLVRYEVKGPPDIIGRSVYFESNVKCVASNGLRFREEKVIDFLYNKTNWRWGHPKISLSKETVEFYDFEKAICQNVYDKLPQDGLASLAKWFKSISLPDNTSLNDICHIVYKDKEYFAVHLSSTIQYNENRLSDYDVAKILFVDPILKYSRTAFDFLNQHNHDSGLSFFIATRLSDFTKTKNKDRDIVIKYFLPNAVIRDFISQNITRQELIDKSLVFIDNDMVRLKFQ